MIYFTPCIENSCKYKSSYITLSIYQIHTLIHLDITMYAQKKCPENTVTIKPINSSSTKLLEL